MAPSQEDDGTDCATTPYMRMTPVGAFDGSTMQLRSFPVCYRWQAGQSGKAKQDSGTVNGVQYQQTMGRILLTFPLTGAHQDLDEDDFKVEMSCWQMKVSTREGKTVISDLTQDFYDDILRELSWWKVEVTHPASNERALIIYLAKANHRAWSGPWFEGGLNPHKKGTFSWGEMQVSGSIVKELRIDSESLRPVEPGEPEDWNHEICTALTPEQICTGTGQMESETDFHVVIHLDEEALDGATARVPLEEIFAADVTADSLTVYLRGDSFSICAGKFAGLCVPELTTWQIRHVRRRNLPEGCDIKAPAFFNPALCIRCIKAKPHSGMWGDVFEELQCSQFGLPRERIDWEERVWRSMVLAPGNHLNKAAKAQRAQALCTRVETSQDLLLNRVLILLHLEAQLPQLCQQFKLEMSTLFTLKVSASIVSVGFVADSEYLVCLGGLGGSCVPEASSLELFMDEGSEEANEAPHPVIKLGLSKAECSRGRWSEVFTRWQPWQLSQSMLEAARNEQHFALEDDDDGLEGIGE
eukprot:gb/GFBE01067168.1/.p1 GENE.gb/GFBE01067168.1/~~gb/GFBE01067168.1/.p1  ORF type:complete len:527 (+),score=106.83 gb/GFBE01067168.1/:1-1581(+)